MTRRLGQLFVGFLAVVVPDLDGHWISLHKALAVDETKIIAAQIRKQGVSLRKTPQRRTGSRALEAASSHLASEV